MNVQDKPLGVADRKQGVSWAERYARLCEHREILAQEIERECAKLVTRRQAIQFGIVPIRWDEGHLEIATTREKVERAMGFCSHSVTRFCRLVLVDEGNLRQLIEQCYT